MAIRSEKDPTTGAVVGKWFSGKDITVLFNRVERVRHGDAPTRATEEIMQPGTQPAHVAHSSRRVTKPFDGSRLL